MALGLFIMMPTPTTESKTNTKSIHDSRLYAQAVYQVPKEVEYKGGNIILKQYKSELGLNCVKYASSKSKLPQGLRTLAQKKSHIKSYLPSPGKIGVTSEGPVGHLVFIEEVKNNSLVISEGNYRRGFITYREISKQNIIGYF